MTTRVVLDMDVGIDDALAIMFLAAHDDVEIEALGSIHGNIDAQRGALNGLSVLELCGRPDVPVAQGATEPLNQPLRTGWVVHGTDGIGNMYSPPEGTITGESAADQILRLSRESPGELHLLATGPLTNLALAATADPEVFTRYKSVVIMGGSGYETLHWGSLTEDPNVDYDPEASDIVYRTPGNYIQIGMNLEPYLVLDETRLPELSNATQPHSEFVWKMLQQYLDFHEKIFVQRRIATLWDPLAAAVLLDPTLIQSSTRRPVDLVPSDLGFRGLGLNDRRAGGRFDERPDVEIVTAVDADRFVNAFLEKLTGPMPRNG